MPRPTDLPDPAGLVLGPGPLGDRRQQLRVVDLLQAPRAPPVVGRAAAEHHHRGSVEVRRRDRADAVGDPRAGGEHGEPGHPVEPGGRLGREHRRLLVPDVDDAHRRICLDRAVVEREDVPAGQREHGRCATSACGGHRLRTAVHGSLAGAARLILAGAARRSLASAAGRCQPRFALVLPFRLAHARDVISRAAGGRRCSRPRPAQPGDDLVPVAPVPGLGPLDRRSGRIEAVPADQQQRQPDVHAEQPGVLRASQHRLDGFLGLGQLDAVGGGQGLIQGGVLLQVLAQPGEAARGQVRDIDGHRLAVGQPQPVRAQRTAAGPDAEEARKLLPGRHVPGVQDHGPGPQAVRPHVLGVAGQFQHLGHLGRGHERPLALQAEQLALHDQLGEGLPDGGAGRAITLGQLTLRRHGGAGRQRPGELEQVPLDAVVLGQPRGRGAAQAVAVGWHGQGGCHGQFLPAGGVTRT